MKKYKLTNFIENHKQIRRWKDINGFIFIFLSVYIIANLFIGTSKIKNLQEYIKNNPYKKSEDIKITQSNHIDMSRIKKTYDIIGKNNIAKLLVNNLTVEIEGQCSDLSILDKVEDEHIKDMSINKIRKEGETYIFNISYVMIDKVEIK